VALTELPGATTPRDRFVPVLAEDGQPLRGPSGTSADTLLLLQAMAAPLTAPLPVEDIRLDRGSTSRDVTAPGVGAWVIP